ncbi:MAG: hypothetical protein CFE21_17945 [Bacteroidetes bacterium B1(2017)]|nr:MAG: hypothetical protein CFE21_17945 [Bacteroidetes bacterium B1(2017)]
MLTREHISYDVAAPVIVLFGCNPFRREEVINHLKQIGDITIYGTLSEEEGMEKITSLPKVDIVLIGGRYSDEQRIRIRKFVAEHLPNTKISEPGVKYPYEKEAINNDIHLKLNLRV